MDITAIIKQIAKKENISYREAEAIFDKIWNDSNKVDEFFYCDKGGIAPVCSDCKRNPINSIINVEDITTWYKGYPNPNGIKCNDYINNDLI